MSAPTQTAGRGPASRPLHPLPALYQANFTAEELTERRRRLAREIGSTGVALVQGAAQRAGTELFRQSNEMYYLTGLETPDAYLLIDAAAPDPGAGTLYLPHRDVDAQRSGGPVLSAEDADGVRRTTGVARVLGVERLAGDLMRLALRRHTITLHTPLQPAEAYNASRDELLAEQARAGADPWDGRPSREGHFVALLRQRFPQLGISDLSPVLDRHRIVKSPREIELMRYAGWLTARGITQAMRATRPGMPEYQLAAVARFEFQAHGARGDGYRAIAGGGHNAWYGHYTRQASLLADGDLVLMDYAPDFAYYTSDIGRMWPVNGTFDPVLRTLYEFILRYHRTLLEMIKPGADPDDIMDRAAARMREVIDETAFATPGQRQAAMGGLEFRGHLSHPVGMAVHDVGDYRGRPLEPGTVFCVDPMIWIEDDEQYVRVEDTLVVTEEGIEVFTADAPLDVADIEATMTQDGLPVPAVDHLADERLADERLADERLAR